ncbi:ABC transporter permease [Vibrio cholerae]|uniref:ABC transporter permease n=1 Tax=Vibrio cholerae TaxID=666 RepID=UPI0008417D77|nr:ABC transporter permease [Vibrio cholerae]EKF6711879.1 ABC transporter permease [Vibrio cholerae]HDZ9289783.1 ABC transporter permease [Vibrio cholerae]
MTKASFFSREWFSELKTKKDLLGSLIARDIRSRYKGSVLGLVWAILTPMMMLIVYTFVFSVVFKARWHGGSGSQKEFALLLFSGLVIFNIFAECINRSPSIIVNNPNFVKKVVFPVELLPVVILGTSLFQGLMSFIVWLIFYMIFFGMPQYTLLLLPVVIFPMILFTLGFSWILASFSVYIRDIIQIVGVVTTILLFLSPVFYSASMLPESFQTIMRINPLTTVIEQARDVMIWGKMLDIKIYVTQLVFSIVICILGYSIFKNTKKGFADVL